MPHVEWSRLFVQIPIRLNMRLWRGADAVRRSDLALHLPRRGWTGNDGPGRYMKRPIGVWELGSRKRDELAGGLAGRPLGRSPSTTTRTTTCAAATLTNCCFERLVLDVRVNRTPERRPKTYPLRCAPVDLITVANGADLGAHRKNGKCKVSDDIIKYTTLERWEDCEWTLTPIHVFVNKIAILCYVGRRGGDIVKCGA